VIWRTKDLDKEQVRALSSKLEVSPLIASILVRRGLGNLADALFLLENKKVFLHNAFLLPDMAIATERIVAAMGVIVQEEGRYRATQYEQIMIVGDRDADGISSTALFANYFQHYGIEPILRLPQGDESYGLTCAVVEEARAAGVTLLICVDNGSSAYEAARLAMSYQIDLLVFDHHDTGKEKLPVVAFVNPKLSDKYPNQQLSASVVVLKAIFCLDFYMCGHFGRCDVLLYAAHTHDRKRQIMALQMINLEIKATMQITLDESNAEQGVLDRERMIRFVQGSELFVFGAKEQIALLGDALGVEVSARDLAGELEQVHPGISQYRLPDVLRKSRFFRYQEQPQLRDALCLLYTLLMTSNAKDYPIYNESFGLATLGLLADLAPLLGENRIIAHHGLALLNSGGDSPLNRLLSQLKLLNTTLTNSDLNWKFIPLINATGRMGQPSVALEALLCTDMSRQSQLASQLTALNEQRRTLTSEWWERLQPQSKASWLKHQKEALFLCANDLPRGLTGLIAGRIARSYDCFALVVAIKPDGVATASMRSPYSYHVAPFIEFCKELFIDAGGHAQAGGFSMQVEHLEELQRRLMIFCTGLLASKPAALGDKEFYYDAKLPAGYFNKEIVQTVERLAPYGVKFESLVFCVSAAKLESATLIGKQEEHLKLGVTIDGQHWQCLFWEAAERFSQLKLGLQLELLCRLRKEYGRFAGFQLELIDFKEELHP
jgi:single-stranded-DNA-specific exonuclease